MKRSSRKNQLDVADFSTKSHPLGKYYQIFRTISIEDLREHVMKDFYYSYNIFTGNEFTSRDENEKKIFQHTF